ncbi:MAG TPA: hypothetical protein VIK78_01535 [Ruminiclostridium sp.]
MNNGQIMSEPTSSGNLFNSNEIYTKTWTATSAEIDSRNPV